MIFNADSKNGSDLGLSQIVRDPSSRFDLEMKNHSWLLSIYEFNSDKSNIELTLIQGKKGEGRTRI